MAAECEQSNVDWYRVGSDRAKMKYWKGSMRDEMGKIYEAGI